MSYVYGKRLRTMRATFINLASSVVLLGSSMGAALPLFLSQQAYAASKGDVWITAAMPNPVSSGTEYVTLKNVSGSSVNLNNWSVDTSSDHTITTAETLASGNSVTICDNPAKDAACDSDYGVSLVLPNSDTTITLKDGSDNVIDQVNYMGSQIATKGTEVTFSSHLSASSVYTPLSSNDQNRIKGWAYVEEVSKTDHDITFKLVSTRNFNSCFEYRADGDTSQVLSENGGQNYNTKITDGLYPYTCVHNNSQTVTVPAHHYVEVRMVFGAENDERFTWTRFDVAADTTAPSVPTLLTPVNRGYEKTNDFYFDWSDSSDANPVTYEFQASQNSHTTGGVLDTGVWDNIKNGNSEQKSLTDSTIHSTGAANGNWYWQVRAIDAAGNKSAWTAPWKLTIDTHAPTGSITFPSADGYLNTRQTGNVLTVTGTSSDNLGLNRVLVQLLTSKHGAIQNQTVYLSGPSDNWQAQFNTKDLKLNDGQYAIVASFDDNAGNVYKTDYVDFTLDNTKPVATFTSATDNPTPNGYYHGNFQVGYSVTDNFKLKSVGVSLFDTNPAHSNHWAAGCYSNGHETSNEDSGTCTIKLGNLPDGKYYVAIQGQDAAGLWTVAATRTITVDRNAFNLGGYVFNNQNQDRDRDAGEETMPGWTLRLYDQDWNKLQEVTTKADGTYKFSTLHDAGTYYVCEVMQTGWSQVKSDWTGTPFHVDTVNQSGQSDEGPFCSTNTYTDQADRSADRDFGNVDIEKPTIEFTDPSIADGAWTNQDFQVSFHAHDNYKLDYVTVGLRDNSNPDVTQQWKAGCSYLNINQSDLTATCAIHLPNQANLPDGTYTVQIGGKALDAPYWTVNKTRTVHIDRTLPTVQVNLDRNGYLTNDSTTGKVQNPEIEAYDTNLTEIQIVDQNGNEVTHWGNGKSSVTPGTTTYKNIGWLGEGTYTIYAYDVANNKSAGFTLTIDNTAPSLTIDTYTGTDTTPTITGTTSDATDVVTVDGIAAKPSATANSGGTFDWSYILPTQTVGTHTVTVISTDLAGNATQETTKVEVTASQTTVTPNSDQHTVTPPQNQNANFLAAPQVLGANTNTPNTPPNSKTSNNAGGQVQGDQTTSLNTGNKDKTITNSSNFLGLGWWWLLVLAVVLGAFWFIFGKANSDDKEA